MSFGYSVLGFGSSATHVTSAPLSIALEDAGGATGGSGDEGEVGVGGSAGATVSNNAGDIDVTATASGGATPYSYAWTASEVGDRDNKWSIGAAGTQNVAQYDDLILTCTGLPAGISTAIYALECTVTDNNSDTAAATYTLIMSGIGF